MNDFSTRTFFVFFTLGAAPLRNSSIPPDTGSAGSSSRSRATSASSSGASSAVTGTSIGPSSHVLRLAPACLEGEPSSALAAHFATAGLEFEGAEVFCFLLSLVPFGVGRAGLLAPPGSPSSQTASSSSDAAGSGLASGIASAALFPGDDFLAGGVPAFFGAGLPKKPAWEGFLAASLSPTELLPALALGFGAPKNEAADIFFAFLGSSCRPALLALEPVEPTPRLLSASSARRDTRVPTEPIFTSSQRMADAMLRWNSPAAGVSEENISFA
mmetsp:Transcript_53107/g.147288  ORF Transcript_53107/g.147288 Transcript_53107/m.147288 type:complete len:272 (+) Transcript_53107:416-1231(+)